MYKLTLRIQSIYSISVLPKSATFQSYFVVLVAFVFVTLLLALQIQRVSDSRDKADFGDQSSSLFTLALTKSLSAIIQMPQNCLSFFASRSIGLLDDADNASKKLTDNQYLRPLCLWLVFLFLGIRGLIISFGMVIYRLMWELPVSEAEQGLNLLSRPRATDSFQPKFSFQLFVWDLGRFLLLPLWVVLIAVSGCLYSVGSLIYRCWIVIKSPFSWIIGQF